MRITPKVTFKVLLVIGSQVRRETARKKLPELQGTSQVNTLYGGVREYNGTVAFARNYYKVMTIRLRIANKIDYHVLISVQPVYGVWPSNSLFSVRICGLSLALCNL